MICDSKKFGKHWFRVKDKIKMDCLNEIGAVVDNVFHRLLHDDGFGFFRHAIRDAGEVLHQHSEPRDAPVSINI